MNLRNELATMPAATAAAASIGPLHERIREALRDGIARNVWRAGEQLPSEADLIAHYGVSRITVRQALQSLEQQGVIVKVPGKGSFVAVDRPFQHLARLQGLGEAMSSQGRSIRNRVLAISHGPADAQVATRLQLREGEIVTHIRRVRLLDGEPVSVDLTWLPRALGEQVAGGDLVSSDIFTMLEHDFDTPLGHADLALDARPAAADIAAELGVAPGSALLHVDRLTHDRFGRPIDYEHLYCRGSDFQFRLRIDRQSGANQ